MPQYAALLAAVSEAARKPAAAAPHVQPLTDRLSERGLEVLLLVSEGISSAKIAERLIIVAGTFKSHMKSIYSKLEVHSHVQAIARARTVGLQ
jgi:LuxR family maltose regulon positive regulatory protein